MYSSTPERCKSGRTEVDVDVEGEEEEKNTAQATPSRFAFAHQLVKVTVAQDKILAEAFPWVDRPGEYRLIVSWLEANPRRRPKNAGRFLHNWFAKQPTPTKRPDPAQGPQPKAPPNANYLRFQELRKAGTFKGTWEEYRKAKVG